jgi:hypothetical protein
VIFRGVVKTSNSGSVDQNGGVIRLDWKQPLQENPR